MAIQKITDLGNGYTAEYYRIIRFNTLINSNTEIVLALYKDKATRDINDNGYVTVKYFTMNIPKEVLISGNMFTYAYQQIMLPNPLTNEDGSITEQNFFADAIIV